MRSEHRGDAFIVDVEMDQRRREGRHSLEGRGLNGNKQPDAVLEHLVTQFGPRLSGGRLVLSVRGQNISDARVQQHNWGDFIGRKITGQVEVRF